MLAYWAPLVGTLVNEADVDPVAPSLSYPAGLASEVSTIAATKLATDLAGGVSDPATLAGDAFAAVLSAPDFAAYFTGTTPNSPQGIVIAGAASAAEQVVVADLAAGTSINPASVGTDIANAIVKSYHGTLIPPACTVAARAFFANF